MPQDPIQERIHRKVLVRRGQWILAIVVALLIPWLMYRIVQLTAFPNVSGLHRWIQLGIAILMLRGCIATWLGNHDSRRFLSLLLLIHALPWGYSLLKLAPASLSLMRTANDGNAAAFLLGRNVLLVMIVPFVFFVATGVILRFSKSVRLFVTTQMSDRTKYRWIPDSLAPWLGRPGIVETVFAIRRDEDKLVYPRLTRELIAVLDEKEHDDAVLDYVNLKFDENDQKPSNEVLRTLPSGVRAYYSLWWLQAEVDNGGLFQFFVNKGPTLAIMAIEACELLDLPDLAGLLRQSLEICIRENKQFSDISRSLQLSTLTTDWANKYVTAEKASSMNDLNEQFYRVPKPHLGDFIRNRPELFEERPDK